MYMVDMPVIFTNIHKRTVNADKPSAIFQCRKPHLFLGGHFFGHTVVQAARLNAGVTGVILQWIVGGCWNAT